MPKSGRKKASAGSDNLWDSTLDRVEGVEPTQAGEDEKDFEEDFEEGRGGGDQGRDTETGSGGYGGDAVLAGEEDAAAEARPLDSEIHGDPRTREGESYPDDAKQSDPGQKSIGRTAEEMGERDKVTNRE